MKINELVKEGFISTPSDMSQFICPVCQKQHIRPWQSRMNAHFDRRPVFPLQVSRLRAAIRAQGLPDDLVAELDSLFAPDALNVHEALAKALEIHEAGRLSWEAWQAISRILG